MKPKLIPLLHKCIENGISYGLYRAYKHTDSPSREVIEETICRAIFEQLYEWFDFDGTEPQSLFDDWEGRFPYEETK